MATEPKEPASKKEEAGRKAEAGARPHRTSLAEEAREDGMPGYGQPDEDVREQSLPEQGW